MLLQEKQNQSQQTKDAKGGPKGEAKPVQQSRDKEQANKAAPAPAAQKHDVKLRAGITSAAVPEDGMADVTRIIPEDEPAQLSPNDELKFIGKRISRVDGPMKTTGRARYTADVY